MAPSDAEGLRAVLKDPGAIPAVLDSARYYRIRCGTAVASSAGDEFERTGLESGDAPDTAAADAVQERERLEGEARRLMEREREQEQEQERERGLFVPPPGSFDPREVHLAGSVWDKLAVGVVGDDFWGFEVRVVGGGGGGGGGGRGAGGGDPAGGALGGPGKAP